VTVAIPPGAEDGMMVRVEAAGDMPVSGKGTPGNLIVRVHVMPSKLFRRQGINLFHEARIPLHTALLRGRVRVPTLDGDVELRVPAGTQPGEEAVLKGRGVPHLHGGSKGDLYVSFAVQLPRSLTPRQREILMQFADDIEGRAPSSLRSSSTGSSTSPSDPAQSSMESQETPPSSTDNLSNSK